MVNYKLKYLKYKLKYKKLIGGMFRFDTEEEIITTISFLINYLDIQLEKQFSIPQDGFDTDDSTDDVICNIKKNSRYYRLYSSLKDGLKKIVDKFNEKKKPAHFKYIEFLERIVLGLQNTTVIELTNNFRFRINNQDKHNLINNINNIISFYKNDFNRSLILELESLSSESE